MLNARFLSMLSLACIISLLSHVIWLIDDMNRNFVFATTGLLVVVMNVALIMQLSYTPFEKGQRLTTLATVSLVYGLIVAYGGWALQTTGQSGFSFYVVGAILLLLSFALAVIQRLCRRLIPHQAL